MKGPRPYVVDKLVTAACEGMEATEEITDSTASEVLSACFTLMLRTLKAVKSNGTASDLKSCRDALEVLLMECADAGHPN